MKTLNFNSILMVLAIFAIAFNSCQKEDLITSDDLLTSEESSIADGLFDDAFDQTHLGNYNFHDMLPIGTGKVILPLILNFDFTLSDAFDKRKVGRSEFELVQLVGKCPSDFLVIL